MNATVVRLTVSSLLGRRRALLLLVLPAVLLALAIAFRLLAGSSDRSAVTLLDGFALGTLVPLVALIAGTGAIGPEIDDGSILYLLAKPLGRHRILQSKLVVAVLVTLVLGSLPVLSAGLVMAGGSHWLAVAYAAAAAVAGVTYCALFVLLAVVTRNAVVTGLLYVLVWESLVGGLVPGARDLSVRQWAMALAAEVVGPAAGDLQVQSAVGLGLGMALLAALTVAATWLAGHRLRSLRVTGDD